MPVTDADTGEPVAGRGPPGGRVALVDLLDRLLAGGVVIAGDVTISIAEVDLVHVSLRALITSVRSEMSDAGTGRVATAVVGGDRAGRGEVERT